jgi:hypothetical protein
VSAGADEPTKSVLGLLGTLCVLPDVLHKVAHEEHTHAEHEDKASQAHEAHIGREQIFDGVHFESFLKTASIGLRLALKALMFRKQHRTALPQPFGSDLLKCPSTC